MRFLYNEVFKKIEKKRVCVLGRNMILKHFKNQTVKLEKNQ